MMVYDWKLEMVYNWKSLGYGLLVEHAKNMDGQWMVNGWLMDGL